MSSTSVQHGPHHEQLRGRPAGPTGQPAELGGGGLVAIDGPAGAGKSSVARALAARLQVPYLDTGAMYRAAGMLAQRSGLEPPLDASHGPVIAELIARHRLTVVPSASGTVVLIDDEDVSAEIRTPTMSAMASAVSALPEVRAALLPVQRSLGARGGVMEGRDIGSVVFPDADLKVFLTASPAERARRRFVELRGRGIETTEAEVRQEQQARDLNDTTRRDAPLQVARGSVVVDTTGMAVDEVVVRIIKELQQTRCPMLDSIGRTP